VSTGACKEPALAHVAELAEITSGSVDKRLAGSVGEGEGRRSFSAGIRSERQRQAGFRVALVDAGGFKVEPRTLVHFGNGAIRKLEVRSGRGQRPVVQAR
jgi:hypothetical protein